MFKINEIVVYRKDLYRVSEIEKMDSNEYKYILVPYQNDDGSLRIQVPASNKMGYLRKLSTEDEIQKMISRIPDISVLQGNIRWIENEYRSKMKHPSLDDLICIIKTSYLRNQDRLEQNKKASAIDSSYFVEAEKLLYQEIGAVLSLSEEEAKNYVISAIKK